MLSDIEDELKEIWKSSQFEKRKQNAIRYKDELFNIIVNELDKETLKELFISACSYMNEPEVVILRFRSVPKINYTKYGDFIGNVKYFDIIKYSNILAELGNYFGNSFIAVCKPKKLIQILSQNIKIYETEIVLRLVC